MTQEQRNSTLFPRNVRSRLRVSDLGVIAWVILLAASTQAWSWQGASSQAPAGLPAVAPPDAKSDPMGSVHGVIEDANGTVYQGVLVTLKPASAEVMSAATDEGGVFIFRQVAPGAFVLTVSSQGFTTQSVSGVLHPGESYDARAIVLPLSTSLSVVTVTASRKEVSEAQLHDEEKQRVFGVLPNYYIAYSPETQPLTPKQKFHLFWRSTIDPVTFLATGAAAGVEQAAGEFNGYGQGAEGYAKRYAANYADDFIGSLIGSAILPSLLKQDPRYYYKGTGSKRSRVLYAIAMTVVCKGDNGHWQPNYSELIADFASAGISNLYYPAKDRNGFALTVENTLIDKAGGAVQNLLQEFLIRKLTPNLPSNKASAP